jgi:hypothetical protein
LSQFNWAACVEVFAYNRIFWMAASSGTLLTFTPTWPYFKA